MNNFTSDNNEEQIEDLPSKTRLKREAHQLVTLGENILSLKKEEIKTLKLPDELEEAIQTALKIKSRSGLKRQRLYIGKLLRNINHEAIEKQLNKINHQHDTNTATFKRLESWRDRLIAGDNQTLSEIIQLFQNVDRQHINQLIRSAKLEQKKDRPPTSARKLFRYLQTLEDARTHNNF